MMDGGKERLILQAVSSPMGTEQVMNSLITWHNPSRSLVRESCVSVKRVDIHVNYSVHVISCSHQVTGRAETTSVMHICLAKGCSATRFLAQEVLRLGHQFPEHFIWYLCSICSSCVQREKLLSLTLGFPIAFLLTVCCLHTLVFLCVGEEQFRLWVCVRKGTGNYGRVKKSFFTYDQKNGLFKFSRQCLNTAQDGLELYMAKNNLEFLIFLPPPLTCWDYRCVPP